MKIIKPTKKGLNLIRRVERDTSRVEETVKEIIEDVRLRGDDALLEYTERFSGVRLRSGGLRVRSGEIKKALKKVSKRDLGILRLAASRIEAFHRHQIPQSWFTTEDGITLGQRVTPLERVGIYVPGGKAVYPSTVLMNAIPARVAGVKEVIMLTPPSKKGIDPYVLTAGEIAGVNRVYQVGGAQAIAAMAYGTETIPRVDKIVGPGNIYVATAKRLVFGAVDIDMVAGPSEILIINDGTGDPQWIAADLLSQAEHDELASAILVTTSSKMAMEVKREVTRQLMALKRKAIARTSIDKYGRIILVKDIKSAVKVANTIAPEHLELFVERPWEVLGQIENAGAIFLGPYTPEVIGDYLAGPNHTLPTGGTARFSSPLGVEDFVKRSSIITFSRKGLERFGRDVVRFSTLEGLEAHGRSVKVRLKYLG